MSSSGKRHSVSDWAYVAIAYTAVWGSLAVYAVVLARRVAQAHRVEGELEQALDGEQSNEDSALCDAPPAP